MIAFGVGCIPFYYESGSEELNSVDVLKFKSDIVEALEKIENIGDLECHHVDDDMVGFNSFENDCDGDQIIVPINFSLEFNLYLPERLQNSFGVSLSTETVFVCITYGYHRPVMFCFVDIDDEQHQSVGSEAVVIVRKYLEEKLSGKLRCKTVGPSPFHANFFVAGEYSESWQLIDKTEGAGGYQDIEVYVPDEASAISIIIERMVPTLSRYYYLSGMQSNLFNDRRIVAAGIQRLLNDVEQSWSAVIKSYLRVGREVNRIQKAIFQEKLNRIDMETFIEDADACDELGVGTPLEKSFNTYRSIAKQSVWSEFADMASFFEERRQKVFSNVTALIAAVLGGVIGAAVGSVTTLYATSFPASSSLQSATTGQRIDNVSAANPHGPRPVKPHADQAVSKAPSTK